MGEGATFRLAALNRRMFLLLVASTLASAQTAKNSYLGSKSCFGCHPAIYKSFEKTGMGRSITLASDWKPSALPAQATVSQPIVPPPTGQPETSRIFTVSHNESGWEQRESVAGEFSVDHQLDYAVGSGYNGLTFLVRRGRFLFQAPLSYYARAQKWDLSPGYENADLGFNRMVPEECINCHAGRPSPLPNVSGGYADPPFRSWRSAVRIAMDQAKPM